MKDFFSEVRSINFVNEKYISELEVKLRQDGFFVYKINGEVIADAQSFFLEIKEKIPLDPPLSGKVNWDAFIDSFWNGLDQLEKNKVAFIWTRADNMLRRGLPDLVLALESFKDVSENISDVKIRPSNPVRLIIFLVGEGENFGLLPK